MGQSHRRAAERRGPPGDATEGRPAMKRALGLTALLAVMAVGISCGGKEPMMSGPGTLLVRLTSPHSIAESAPEWGDVSRTSSVPGPDIMGSLPPQLIPTAITARSAVRPKARFIAGLPSVASPGGPRRSA